MTKDYRGICIPISKRLEEVAPYAADQPWALTYATLPIPEKGGDEVRNLELYARWTALAALALAWGQANPDNPGAVYARRIRLEKIRRK